MGEVPPITVKFINHGLWVRIISWSMVHLSAFLSMYHVKVTCHSVVLRISPKKETWIVCRCFPPIFITLFRTDWHKSELLICSLTPRMTCHRHVVFVLNSPVMYFFPGFEITIDHPHTDVVKCTQLVRGRGFLLCSLCPLLLFVPPQLGVGRGEKALLD